MDQTRAFLVFLYVLYWYSLGVVTVISRYKRESSDSCDPGISFACQTGECINKDRVCDGHNHCTDGDDESENSCECGLSRLGNYMNVSTPDIIEASLGEYPWQAGVYIISPHTKYKLLCSGTLIYPDVVLTSASGLFNLDTYSPEKSESVKVGLGRVKREYNTDEEHQQKFDVYKIVPHPRYEGDYKHYNYNMALLLLETKVDINDYVRPICIWNEKKLPPVQPAWTTGWGLQWTNNFDLNMKQAHVGFISASVCSQNHSDILIKQLFTNDKFCITFNREGKKVIDPGSSVIISHNGKYYLIGVISIKHTGTPNFAFTTFPYKYLKWIRNETYQHRTYYMCSSTVNAFYCTTNVKKCVKYEQVCDGQDDCGDGSDEANCDLRIQEYSSDDRKCEIPTGRAIYDEIGCKKPKGCLRSHYVPDRTTVVIKCPESYGFEKSDKTEFETTCNDGLWFPPFNDTCNERCRVDLKSLSLTCRYNERPVGCNKPLRPGTIIQADCHSQFQMDLLVKFVNETTCRNDGTLTKKLVKCIPVCGVPNISVKVLISNGEKAVAGKYPWHVALYWLIRGVWSYKCGGTLITSNKILTAGHCLYEQSTNTFVNNSTVAVKGGKYHSSWFKEDPFEKAKFVHKIVLGENFDGKETNYAQDIAVLILSEDFKLNNHISPVCLDLYLRFGGIPSKQLGHIAGWGKISETVLVSDVLRETTLTYLDLRACKAKFPKTSFRRYLSHDKFCVLYKNGSGPQVGDSGGGLTFTHGDIHYLYGVVSLKPQDSDDFAAFTDISKHGFWLQTILDEE